MVKRGQLTDVWHANKQHYTDCGRILGKSQADVRMEERIPAVGCRQKYGKQESATGSDDGVEKCRKGQAFMNSLEFLDGLMKIYDTIQEGEDFRRESRHIAHGPVMGIDDCQNIMHPSGMNEGPCHERKEGNLLKSGHGVTKDRWEAYVEGVDTKRIDVLGKNTKWAGNPNNCQGLNGKSAVSLPSEASFYSSIQNHGIQNCKQGHKFPGASPHFRCDLVLSDLRRKNQKRCESSLISRSCKESNEVD